MKFGVREICDVTFKALSDSKLGKMPVKKGQPVLFIDSAKTSTLEGAGTTVYATGGKGNNRLIAWEGERTLTFTVEDALLSDIGFAVLSGAGLFDLAENTAMVHCTAIAYIDSNKHITLEDKADSNAPIFVMKYDKGSIGELIEIKAPTEITDPINGTKQVTQLELKEGGTATGQVFVDYYVKKASKVTEIQIDADNFGGYYYVEASTLFRGEEDGVDYPVELVIPKVKVQSNFTFNMSNSGDPSTFSFVMDAMPGYTMFDRKKKVLCAMQILSDGIEDDERNAVTDYTAGEVDSDVTDGDSLGNARG